jgi:hypothetical protein
MDRRWASVSNDLLERTASSHTLWLNDHAPCEAGISNLDPPVRHELPDVLERTLTVREGAVVAVHKDQHIIPRYVAGQEVVHARTIKLVIDHQMDVLARTEVAAEQPVHEGRDLAVCHAF